MNKSPIQQLADRIIILETENRKLTSIVDRLVSCVTEGIIERRELTKPTYTHHPANIQPTFY